VKRARGAAARADAPLLAAGPPAAAAPAGAPAPGASASAASTAVAEAVAATTTSTVKATFFISISLDRVAREEAGRELE
jgi:hypothetical protein